MLACAHDKRWLIGWKPAVALGHARTGSMAINAAGDSGRRSIAAFAIRGGFGDSPNGDDGNPHDNVIFREPFAFRGAGWLRLPPL